MVWRDFAIARDDRREVPLDSVERAGCQAVAIIEEYAGWTGTPGEFVEAAIAAGFFQVVPCTEESADLVLVDFFPANHNSANDISASKRGGIAKGLNLSRAEATKKANEQLSFFDQSGDEILSQFNRVELRDAIHFIHQLCTVLRRPAPASREWKEAITAKAIAMLKQHPVTDRDFAFKWFIANRSSQEIPPRLDFIIDQFPTFVSKGRDLFGK